MSSGSELAVTETTPQGATVTSFRIDIPGDGNTLVNGKPLDLNFPAAPE